VSLVLVTFKYIYILIHLHSKLKTLNPKPISHHNFHGQPLYPLSPMSLKNTLCMNPLTLFHWFWAPILDLHFPELHHSIVVEYTAFWALLDLLASALQDTTFFCWFLQRSFELHGVPNSELLSSHSRT
jgi:hypothetical protein